MQVHFSGSPLLSTDDIGERIHDNGGSKSARYNSKKDDMCSRPRQYAATSTTDSCGQTVDQLPRIPGATLHPIKPWNQWWNVFQLSALSTNHSVAQKSRSLLKLGMDRTSALTVACFSCLGCCCKLRYQDNCIQEMYERLTHMGARGVKEKGNQRYQ